MIHDAEMYERLAKGELEGAGQCDSDSPVALYLTARAQVYATLAVAAATEHAGTVVARGKPFS